MITMTVLMWWICTCVTEGKNVPYWFSYCGYETEGMLQLLSDDNFKVLYIA